MAPYAYIDIIGARLDIKKPTRLNVGSLFLQHGAVNVLLCYCAETIVFNISTGTLNVSACCSHVSSLYGVSLFSRLKRCNISDGVSCIVACDTEPTTTRSVVGMFLFLRYNV